jgi:hypothetical protein
MKHDNKIIIQPIKYRKRDHVAIISLSNYKLDEIVREIEGAEWSSGYRFWHIPLTNEVVSLLKKLLSKIAIVDVSAFQGFNYTVTTEHKPIVRKKRIPAISVAQREKVEKVEKILLKQGYSDSSVKVLSNLITLFLKLVRDDSAKIYSPDEINSIVSNYIEKNSLSMSYKKLIITAVNKYYSALNAN